KGAVGNLDHDGVAESRLHLVQLGGIVPAQNPGAGGRHLELVEQVRQVDLVGASQNRTGVVHHHHALGLGALGEAVGVVVDIGGFANKEAVVFRQPLVIPGADNVHVDAHIGARLDEFLQCLGVTGGHGLVGVDQ